MTHQSGHRNRIVTLDEFSGAKSMTCSVAEHAFASDFRDTMETVADGVLRPWRSSIIEKEFTSSAFGHKALDDLQGDPMQVNNAFVSLALRFVRREHNALMNRIKVSRLDVTNFLRACARIPNEIKDVSERIIFREHRKNSFKIIFSHVSFTPFCLRFLESSNGISLCIPQFNSPIIEPFNGNDSASLIGITPRWLRIYPFRNMVWLEVFGRYARIIAQKLQKVFQVALIPLDGTWRAVHSAPGKIFKSKGIKCESIFHAINIA